jgi:hypothetical protein
LGALMSRILPFTAQFVSRKCADAALGLGQAQVRARPDGGAVHREHVQCR